MLFSVLKTDLLPISRSQVDELENYVLAHGIWVKLVRRVPGIFTWLPEGGRWCEVDQLRRQIVSWLRPVIVASKQAETTGASLPGPMALFGAAKVGEN